MRVPLGGACGNAGLAEGAAPGCHTAFPDLEPVLRGSLTGSGGYQSRLRSPANSTSGGWGSRLEFEVAATCVVPFGRAGFDRTAVDRTRSDRRWCAQRRPRAAEWPSPASLRAVRARLLLRAPAGARAERPDRVAGDRAGRVDDPARRARARVDRVGAELLGAGRLRG